MTSPHDEKRTRPATSTVTSTNEYSPETTIPINENMSKPEHQSATDLADEIDALRDTVEQQQQEIERLREQKRKDKATVREALKGLDIPKPTRRQLLKSGAGSAAAMLAIWSATGGASAATIGDSSNPWDWYVNDIYDTNDNNPMSFPGDGSVDIDEITINEVAAKVYQTSAQTISGSTETTLQMDTDANYPSGDVLTVDLANNKITIEKNGVYFVEGVATLSNAINDGTRIIVRVTVGGSDKVETNQIVGGSNVAGINAATTAHVENAPTDCVVKVFHDDSQSLDTIFSEKQVHLSVGRLG